MLVSNNYCVDVNKLNKHAMPDEADFSKADIVLAIFKRLDLWIGSALRTPTNLPEMRPEMYHDGRLVAEKAVDVYGKFYAAWAQQDNVIAVSYADLLRDTVGVLTDLAKRLGWGLQPAHQWRLCGPDKMPEWRKEMYLET